MSLQDLYSLQDLIGEGGEVIYFHVTDSLWAAGKTLHASVIFFGKQK